MSVSLFDLGQRLRAATLGQPVARSRFTPVIPPSAPVAVTVTSSGHGVVVRAADEVRAVTASGQDALAALAELGVSVEAESRTLVVADRGVVSQLEELARQIDPAAPSGQQAAVVGWWAQRADHPGTSAVLNVIAACSDRWVLGVPPAAERQLTVWRQWLAVREDGPGALLRMAAAVSDGPQLPGLDACAEDDLRSWEAFAARMADPALSWDWRRRDSRREAALGLATRSDAAELYESLRLGDPLVATRESFGGRVVSGVVTSIPSRSEVVVTLDRLACRLRESGQVEGFRGHPRDLPAAGASGARVRGRVAGTRVTADERLVLRIDNAVVRAFVGERLTLRPQSVDPRQQRSGRQELHRRYAARRSWLSGGAAPLPRRRDLPLEVAIAAAE